MELPHSNYCMHYYLKFRLYFFSKSFSRAVITVGGLLMPLFSGLGPSNGFSHTSVCSGPPWSCYIWEKWFKSLPSICLCPLTSQQPTCYILWDRLIHLNLSLSSLLFKFSVVACFYNVCPSHLSFGFIFLPNLKQMYY